MAQLRSFDVVVVVSDPAATRRIREHLGGRGGAGLLVPPEGGEVKDEISVTQGGGGRDHCIHGRVRTASIKGSVTTTSVRDGQRVGRAVDPLLGVYRDVAIDADLWIFVYSDIARRYYPQTHQIDIARPADLLDLPSKSGRFRSYAAFGGVPGERYELLAVLAEKSASAFLSETLRVWHRARDFRGLALTELPKGLDEKHCVTVFLKMRPRE